MDVNNQVDILGFKVSTQTVSDIVSDTLKQDELKVINTLNPHSYVVQKKDEIFSASLKESDVLIPDGVGVLYASIILANKKLIKIAGFDLYTEALRQLNEQGGKVFFLGSTDVVLSKIKSRLVSEFQNIEAETLSPEFKISFDACDLEFFASSINIFNPDILFVGLTAPKQEKLIRQLKPILTGNLKMVSGIGAVFDFYAGTVKRPGKLWILIHMEWLGRLIMEPKRLWRRVFVSTPIFAKDVLLSRFN
jgi:N-acetylglucosaminyldiphosphoundecaprenol N-acetyl-beta-D-mannosaminyltransferase